MIEWSNLQKVSTDTLSKERLFRLKNAESILGEPDLISISKTIITSSFLSQKKQI